MEYNGNTTFFFRVSYHNFSEKRMDVSSDITVHYQLVSKKTCPIKEIFATTTTFYYIFFLEPQYMMLKYDAVNTI